MNRRLVIAGVAAMLAPTAPGVRSAAAGRLYRIGVLSGASLSDPANTQFRIAFADALHARGWVEGSNIVIENRATEGRAERFAELAAELVAANVTSL